MSRLNVGIAGIVMTLMGVAVMPKDSTAHQGNDTPAASPANLSTSVGECKVCHSDPTAIGLRDFEKCGSKTYIRLDESVIWEKDDSHRRAYAALISPLGRQMGERLKMKSDMTTNLACLACHATDTQPKSATKSLTQFVRSESLGIGCQACHGVGKTWQNEHYQIEETPGRSTIPWRTKSPAEKDKAGMINLRNPEIKASLCVSCHVGNVREGKIITHEMYAAGHPPLPPIELGTFINDQPAHWKLPFDLEYFQSLPADQAKSLYSYDPDEGRDGYATRQTVIGLLTAVKAEVELIQYAAGAANESNHSGLNYARLDCYACHHDLKTPSDRQTRGYDGPPGRPPMKAWIQLTSRVIAAEFAKMKDLKVHGDAWPDTIMTFQKAILAKPFGDPDAIRKAAPTVIAWCDTSMSLMTQKLILTPERCRSFQTAFKDAAISDRALADPEASIVMTWAYRSLTPSTRKGDVISTVIPTRVRGSDWLKKLNTLKPEDIRKAFQQ
jgi:hypothetical protein